ncbi:hypothetical protein [Leptolyngbya sp. FACHB-16]|uniref:hypothetical protein n=1 Tax=unclassified Leptolyngbya TaxID=2650499 RepID=UPI001689F591|nr:hypothetical protein [Leptolyngbya sp. FACHB-16]MBD2156029.1 hypothetical protein [Leptolyngbya sp. FACHB-16]
MPSVSGNYHSLIQRNHLNHLQHLSQNFEDTAMTSKRPEYQSVQWELCGRRDAAAGNLPRSRDKDYRKGYNAEKNGK